MQLFIAKLAHPDSGAQFSADPWCMIVLAANAKQAAILAENTIARSRARRDDASDHFADCRGLEVADVRPYEGDLPLTLAKRLWWAPKTYRQGIRVYRERAERDRRREEDAA